jgi:peptidoglycan/xylan/chitin deacetylase (PgdA/CDA1 family)
MSLNLPKGKSVAVSITPDFDAQSAWIGGFGLSSPSYLSRGEFGAEVGVPRLLDVLSRYSIPSTFFVPGHSMVTFPHRLEQIMTKGHEIASHGCYHEAIPKLDPERERELMVKQLEQYKTMVGGRPRGYRSPAWDFSDITLKLLEEFGFEWDSSLMGRDFEPYHPREVEVHLEEASIFGVESKILEFPVSWFLDDWPTSEYVAGISEGLHDHEVVFRRWKDMFDFARELDGPSVYNLTIHPQVIGRAHMIQVLDKLLKYISGFPEVWFVTLSQVYDSWEEPTK